MTLEQAKEVLRPLIAMMTDQWGCPISDVPIALGVLLNKVEAEPVRHGRWINGKCSECGCDKVITKVYRDDEVAWTATYKDNYCPNCGSRMDLDEVNDETN